ncbi:MAG: DUF86 domain-containing protein [Bryobacteraceae bacterium]
MRRDGLRLLDIVEAAETVAGYVAEIREEQFLSGGLARDAILRQLMVAGEAAFKISAALQDRHDEIPRRKIIGFRHRVVHDYFGIDLDAVWKIATVELPLLREQAIAVLAAEFPEEPYGV